MVCSLQISDKIINIRVLLTEKAILFVIEVRLLGVFGSFFVTLNLMALSIVVASIILASVLISLQDLVNRNQLDRVLFAKIRRCQAVGQVIIY